MKAAQARVGVEQTFGLLKSRLPALRSLFLKLHNRRTQATAYSMILAACVLHNLLLDISDSVDILDDNEVLLLMRPSVSRSVGQP